MNKTTLFRSGEQPGLGHLPTRRRPHFRPRRDEGVLPSERPEVRVPRAPAGDGGDGLERQPLRRHALLRPELLLPLRQHRRHNVRRRELNARHDGRVRPNL